MLLRKSPLLPLLVAKPMLHQAYVMSCCNLTARKLWSTVVERTLLYYSERGFSMIGTLQQGFRGYSGLLSVSEGKKKNGDKHFERLSSEGNLKFAENLLKYWVVQRITLLFK
jgi:hypothetical protein